VTTTLRLSQMTPEQAELARAREIKRSRRQRSVRSRSIHVYRTGKAELERLRAENAHDAPALDAARPKRRLECMNGPRPCPFVGCKFNLFLDVSERTGSIKLNFPDLEPGDMPPESSCVLDIAERGGLTLEQAGEVLNVTRESMRQLEELVLHKLKRSALANHEEDEG
jgi:hypothetical protein